ncbi:MAG: DUF1697 domain-containing protein [Thermoanaerobaculia bacterium]
MTRRVALLRGINVGKAKRVAMAELRALVERLGYDEVRTLLNSGNVVFSAASGGDAAIAQRLGQALADELGVAAQVVVKSAATFEKILAENPLVAHAADPSRLFVTFTQSAADLVPLADLARPDPDPDAFVCGRHAAYLWCPQGILESALATTVARRLGDRGTTRNWSTTRKLGELLRSQG